VRGLGLDGEDSLALDAPRDPLPPAGRDVLKVAVARLPRISNFTDLDALAYEPGVAVSFTESFQEILAADLAVLPGTKATVADLAWLRSRALDQAFAERVRRGLPTLGICGGYQMLGGRIRDGVESGEVDARGLGLLPVETIFEEEKLLTRPEGWALGFGGEEVWGYEIRHGRVRRYGGEPLFAVKGSRNDSTEGCRVWPAFGASWHGVFESDGFRRAFLRWVAEERNLDWMAGDVPFAARREAQLDALGDLVAENLDREALLRLVEDGAPEGLPAISSQLFSRQPYSRQPPAISRQLVSQVPKPPRAVVSQKEVEAPPRGAAAVPEHEVKSIADKRAES
jgi:adenosylcobyric acid synthase